MDEDGDGYGDEHNPRHYDGEAPEGCVGNAMDPNDGDPYAHPWNREICDGLDNDDDYLVDEEDDDLIGALTWYQDADGDGYGSQEETMEACSQPEGYVSQPGDHDDGDPESYAGASEACDGKDNDGDGEIDEGLPFTTWYMDADGDGFGDANVSLEACAAPEGYVENDEDCDDTARHVYPQAVEYCDGVDDDCDGAADDDDSDVHAPTWYADGDQDGYGVWDRPLTQCTDPGAYYARLPGDCDDNADHVHPGAPDTCGDSDDNCDGIYQRTWYLDVDGDGYGVDGKHNVADCEQPSDAGDKLGGQYVLLADDCDDDDDTIHPGSDDACKGCLGDWYPDQDQDGYGDEMSPSVSLGCEDPAQHVPNNGDCDDNDDQVHPDAKETCWDGIDSDCDGFQDLADEDSTNWYVDEDGDERGFADSWLGRSCDPPLEAGCANNDRDCDDSDTSIHGDAEEVADGKDNDCDGYHDEDFIDEGDLLVTELMIDPAGYDEDNEWFELYNASDHDIVISEGWSFLDRGTDIIQFVDLSCDDPVIGPGERLLFAVTGDAVPGEQDCEYPWSDFTLHNGDGGDSTDDQVIVHYSYLQGDSMVFVQVDEQSYATEEASNEGFAWVLDVALNDWCMADDDPAYSSEDTNEQHGSPGYLDKDHSCSLDTAAPSDTNAQE